MPYETSYLDMNGLSHFWNRVWETVKDAQNYGDAVIPINAVKIPVIIPKGRMRGDIDGDGKITDNDVILAMQISVGSGPTDPISYWCADADEDGFVDSTDARWIMEYISGKRNLDFKDYYENWVYDSTTKMWETSIQFNQSMNDKCTFVYIPGFWKKNAFADAQLSNGVFSIKAKAIPIVDIESEIWFLG